MARRSKLQIYLDVLSVIKDGRQKPTNIMYEANLSWKPLKRVLENMVSQGLVEEVLTSEERRRDRRTSRRYELTRKGDSVIGYFRGAKPLLELDEILMSRW
ncbi:hypothetical protein HQ586_02260 [Candidatus Bathyarchaeota archaeon]|nr:hypothetical protein [Candidatus Bathyarchaeota archaeon]